MTQSRPKLLFDGWYSHRSDAEGILEYIAGLGCTPVGIVENKHGTFGLLYIVTDSEIPFRNHLIDAEGNAVWSALWAETSK